MPRYLASGRYEPRPSVPTLANAMDVGNPSNLERMRWLFNDDVEAMRAMITPSVHTDADVRLAIRDIWTRHGYVADPHTAIAYLGLSACDRIRRGIRMFLATAHPAKFREIVEPIIGESVPLPPALAEALARQRVVQRIAADLGAARCCRTFDAFREISRAEGPIFHSRSNVSLAQGIRCICGNCGCL